MSVSIKGSSVSGRRCSHRCPFIKSCCVRIHILIDRNISRQHCGVRHLGMFIKPHEFIRRADKICSAFIRVRLRISLSVPCRLHLQGICRDLYFLSLYLKASIDRFIPGTGDDIIISSCRKCIASICLCLQILTWPLRTGHCDHRCDLFAISRSNITKCDGLLWQLSHGDTLCILCFIASH